MRLAIATALLLGGLAACSQGPSESAPPPAPAAAPMAAPPAAMAGFDGHYVGTGVSSSPGAACAGDQAFDFTVAGNQINGTVTATRRAGGGRSAAGVRTVSADLTGTVDPSGKATLELHPHTPAAPRGTFTGQFASGQFTGHRGPPCERTITAGRQ